MSFCIKCGHPVDETSCPFCGHCGTRTRGSVPPSPSGSAGIPPPFGQPVASAQGALTSNSPHHVVARGFAQTFGLHPAAALLTVVVDTMIFGSAGVAAIFSLPTGLVSLLILLVVSIACGIIVGIITYMAQKKWYDDDNESAVIKALIVGFLTAIPVGLPGYLTIPSGIIGFFRRRD